MFRSAVEQAGLTLAIDVPPTPTVVDIDPEMWAGELGRVFERFHQVAGAQCRTGLGAGIGLALVADLVSANDGRIEVESTPTRGSNPAPGDHWLTWSRSSRHRLRKRAR